MIPRSVTILAAIAKRKNFKVDYFETTFYQKKASDSENRSQDGEYKEIKPEHRMRLLPFERLFIDLEDKINTFKPDIIAVPANSMEFDFFCKIVEQVKFTEKPFIIAGGLHATIAPESVIQHSFIDAICIGEGEGAWQEFLDAFVAGKRENIRNIKNLWVKEDGTIYRNEIRELLSSEELWDGETDESFFSDVHYLKPFHGEMKKRGFVEMSRGCPYNCNYCVNTVLKRLYMGKGKYLRIRPFDNLKKEVIRRVADGCEVIQFQDENFFNISVEYLKELCEWYKKEMGGGGIWFCKLGLNP